MGDFVEINWMALDRFCSSLDSEKAPTPFITKTLIQILYRPILHGYWHTPCSSFTQMPWPIVQEPFESESGLRFQPSRIR